MHTASTRRTTTTPASLDLKPRIRATLAPAPSRCHCKRCPAPSAHHIHEPARRMHSHPQLAGWSAGRVPSVCHAPAAAMPIRHVGRDIIDILAAYDIVWARVVGARQHARSAVFLIPKQRTHASTASLLAPHGARQDHAFRRIRLALQPPVRHRIRI